MDAAWAQCLAESSGEALHRGLCSAAPGDACALAWGACCARAFGRAWAHADAMSGAALRDEYAAVLTAADGALARRGLDALAVDFAAVLAVARARGGREAFADRVKAVEGACARVRRRAGRRSSRLPQCALLARMRRPGPLPQACSSRAWATTRRACAARRCACSTRCTTAPTGS